MLTTWIISLVLAAPTTERAKVEVTSELVATVQNAVRWGAPAWKPARVLAVTAALNATDAPALMLAIAVLESDLRPRALKIRAWVGRPTRHGSGGWVVTARAAWRSSAVITEGPEQVADVGLCGVACLLGTDGRCTNGPAAGLTIEQLRDPATNIRVAAAVLAAHRGDLRRYHGSSNRRDTYQARALALVAAFSGVVVPVRNARTRAHVRMIAAAVSRSGN